MLLFPTVSDAQEKKVKSFGKMQKPEDVTMLLRRAEAISEKDPKASLKYIEQALNKSLKDGDKTGEANTYNTLGKINYNQNLYTQSISAFQKALKIYTSLLMWDEILDCKVRLGQAYEGSSDFKNALDQYNGALSYATKFNYADISIDILYKIGSVYEKQGLNDEALKLYNDILVQEEKRGNKSGVITSNNRIGNVYLQQDKTKKALQHYEKSQNIAKVNKIPGKVSESYDNIGNTFRKDKMYEEEIVTRKRSAEVKSELADSAALAKEYVEIGKVYLEQNETDEALNYLKKGEAISRQMGDKQKQAEAFQAMSEVYKEQGDYVNALAYYQNYVTAKDSILSAREKHLASLVAFSDELGAKQTQIEMLEKDMSLLKEEKKFSRLMIYGLSAGLLLVFVSSWLIYKSARKRRLANMELALKSLRSQMNPHFIFNALNSVNNYISKNDERSANKYLSDFSKLMRTVMENSQHEFITLSTELEVLKLYLSLEHSRFKEKFDYELNISEDIITDQVEVPPMLIQPYIENAVWHGLRYRDTKGFLKVDIKIGKGNVLQVSIEDNGIGRKKSQELKTVNQKDKISTGMKNTESRLKIINELYKAGMTVLVEDLDNKNNSGTKVTLYITRAKTLSV